MEETKITIKAYRYRNSEDVIEIRRYGIFKHMLTRPDSISVLASTLDQMFENTPACTSSNLIFWKDEDDDFIRIESSADLNHAIENKKTETLKLHLRPVGSKHPGDGKKTSTDTEQTYDPKWLHKLVICDGCESQVYGYRFKCVQCPDYDLCEACFKVNKHPNHVMVRLLRSDPSQQWKSMLSNLLGPNFSAHRECPFGSRNRRGFRRFFAGNGRCNPPFDAKQRTAEGDQMPSDNNGNMWNEYIKQWSQTLPHLLNQFGIDAMVDLDYPNMQTNSKPKESDNSGEKNGENAQPDKQSHSDELGATASASPSESAKDLSSSDSNDSLSDTEKTGWTVVDKQEATTDEKPHIQGSGPEHEQSDVEIPPELEQQYRFLIDMGFKNDKHNLCHLLKLTGGNISAILEMLN